MDNKTEPEAPHGFAAHLASFASNFRDLEATARKLPNKNFADIVASAAAKVEQLVGHPDVHVVGEKLRSDAEEADQGRFPFRTDKPE